MKKITAIILTIIMCFSVVACGSNSKTQTAYDNITQAYEFTEEFCDDIYSTWRLAIYHKSEIRNDAISYLAEELSLNEDEISEGMVYSFFKLTDVDYETASEEQKQQFRDDLDFYIYFMENSMGNELFEVCIFTVCNAYAANGKVAQAEAALAEAKEIIQGLDDDKASALKDYYSATKSLLDFCQEPVGSYEQAGVTINKYKNDIRDARSNLEIDF